MKVSKEDYLRVVNKLMNQGYLKIVEKDKEDPLNDKLTFTEKGMKYFKEKYKK